MEKSIFSGSDFNKKISIGDQLVFEKQGRLETIRIELTWEESDLDVCAFMLGDDEMIHDKLDLVYFNSERRWKPNMPFSDPNFKVLPGKVSTWEKDNMGYKNQKKWKDAPLPLSADDSVIGSWDDMDNDDCIEIMHVRLDEVDTHKYASIVFAAAIAKDRIAEGIRFKDVGTPVVRIFDADTDELLAEYKLDQDFPDKDVVRFGRVFYNDKGLWTFEATALADNGGMEYLAMEVYD